MKLKIIFIIFCSYILSGIPGISAQNVIPGLTVGASLNTMDLDVSPDFSTNLGKVNGVEAGLYVSFSSGSWYFKPMAVASFLKGKVTNEVDGIKLADSDFNLTTLETPVFVGLKLLPGISIEAGPSWNYVMSYTESINQVSLDLSRHTLGYRAGIKASFARLGAFAHYGGIINVNDSNYDLDRPSRIIFGATFDLVKSE